MSSEAMVEIVTPVTTSCPYCRRPMVSYRGAGYKEGQVTPTRMGFFRALKGEYHGEAWGPCNQCAEVLRHKCMFILVDTVTGKRTGQYITVPEDKIISLIGEEQGNLLLNDRVMYLPTGLAKQLGFELTSGSNPAGN